MKTRKVVAFFDDTELAEKSIRQLKMRGFGSEDISVIQKQAQETPDEESIEIKVDQDDEVMGKTVGGVYNLERGTGTMAGAGLGAMAGLLLGAGAMAIPGIGALAAAGPVAGALIGATGGSIAGALNDLGVSDGKSRHFQDKVAQGDILIMVHSNDEKAEEAVEILLNNGGRDVELH